MLRTTTILPCPSSGVRQHALVSDTHSEVEALEQAVWQLRQRGAEALVHCGDIGSPDCLRVLGRAGVPAFAVCGNTDRHADRLMTVAAGAGVGFHSETIEVPLGDGRFLIATHGDDEQLIGELIAGGQFPYVCHGHTHRRRDDRIGPVHVINPGALHHGNPPSVALLDTTTDEVSFIELT